MSRVSLKPASVSRAFVVLLFFSRRLNVTCAGGERKKYISMQPILFSLRLHSSSIHSLYSYTRVLIERISFVVLVVVTEERTEALNYYSTHAYNCRNRKAFSGKKKCISKPHKLHAREAQQNTTPRKNSHRDILPQKCPSSTTA